MQNFCSTLLLSLADTNSPDSWSLETKALALTALRIFAREREATEPLTCTAGLRPVVELAELHSDVQESCFASGDPVPSGKVQGDFSVSLVKIQIHSHSNHLANPVPIPTTYLTALESPK